MNINTGNVTFPKGFTASGVYCGIRKNKSKLDLALIYSQTECAAAACYTKNLVKGAPIYVTMDHISNGKAKAVICNSGNANTCNADGIDVAKLTCAELAKELNIKDSDIVIASTGVIGQPLNVGAILSGIPSLVSKLSRDGGDSAAEAIMTTDLAKKEIAISIEIGGKEVRIGGFAKGSGMINPNMATMLSFITTDVAIESEILKEALTLSVNDTYNMVSVDGDTSTNDMVSVLANGLAENAVINEKNDDFYTFLKALTFVNTHLSRMIARDGEGATRLLECIVQNAADVLVAKKAAKAVISSSLVKAAMFGADANWGRILCAIGYAGCELDITKVDIAFSSVKGTITVCKNGAGVDFDEVTAKEILLTDEIKILVDLKQGEQTATAWGCDLTYDYVKINGDYRT